MPLSRRKATGWADGLDLPRGGETVIYTGQMYQLMPSIVGMQKMMAHLEDSWIAATFGLGRIINKLVNVSWFMAWPSRKEQQAFDGMLRNIARLLKAASVEFGYLYGDELYAGALIYDEGVDDVFEKHAHRVYDVLKRYGVKRVITVDPHTTHVLKTIYPKIIEGYQLEVKSYLQVLAEQNAHPAEEVAQEVVIHDSCIYARHEGMVDEPRCLLKAAGVKLNEPEYTGRLTHCCGGPIESLFPSKAHAIAEKRIDQLAGCGSDIVTMCPICLINLRDVARERNVSVKDISQYLMEASSIER